VIDRVAAILGLSSSGREDLSATLRSDNLELTAEAAAELFLADPTEEIRALQESAGPYACTDAAIAGLLATRLGSPGASIYEQTQRALSEHQPHTDFVHWRATCSLDLPKVLDGGQQPIYCIRRGHQGFGTRLKALEYTYYPQVKSGFDGAVSDSGAVVGSGYRNDIDTPLPNEFFQSFEPLNEGQGWLYALYLFEGTQSKLVAKAVSLLPGQRRKLKDLISQHADSSKHRFGSVLSSLGVPAAMINPVLGLITLAAQQLVTVVVDFLVKRFSETRLTPWTIWHTVLMGSAQVPISIFTIAGREATTPPLCRLVKDSAGQWIPDDKYGGYMAAQQGGCRFMVGETQLPTAGIDATVFDLAATTGQPLAWQEPLQSRGGFRILLPHMNRTLDPRGDQPLGNDRYKNLAAKSEIMYISALRADVHLDFDPAIPLDTTAVRKPTGQGGSFGI
jgi:hypothetical protein